MHLKMDIFNSVFRRCAWQWPPLEFTRKGTLPRWSSADPPPGGQAAPLPAGLPGGLAPLAASAQKPMLPHLLRVVPETAHVSVVFLSAGARPFRD